MILSTTIYDYPYASAVQQGNVMGTQFHPEKSGAAGNAVAEEFYLF